MKRTDAMTGSWREKDTTIWPCAGRYVTSQGIDALKTSLSSPEDVPSGPLFSPPFPFLICGLNGRINRDVEMTVFDRLSANDFTPF